MSINEGMHKQTVLFSTNAFYTAVKLNELDHMYKHESFSKIIIS